ncbi:MAG: YeiH family protein [Pseudonocardiales bacterium]
MLTGAGLRDRLAAGFRTEFFIKTGLVLLGASINLSVIVSAAGPALVQAVLLITIVFGFTWWLGGKLGLDDKLRALLASAVSICGVSAAIAAAGAVQAKKEQLAYTASLVIAFALPSIFILPWAAQALGLPDPVAGAWIGGNIDTTAAVTAAGALAGEDALQIASIVKVTQNALMGVVAVVLTAYFLRTWFFILAFVSIGLEFRVASLRQAGWRPVGVFAAATGVNLVVALGLATLLFSSFQLAPS